MGERRPTSYRKKPVVIEAMGPIDHENASDIAHWCGGTYAGPATGSIAIATLEGEMTAQQGDYVLRGVEGEFYACKPGIFAATYDEVPTDAERD